MKWRIGRVTVTKIVELEVTGGGRFILTKARKTEWEENDHDNSEKRTIPAGRSRCHSRD